MHHGLSIVLPLHIRMAIVPLSAAKLTAAKLKVGNETRGRVRRTRHRPRCKSDLPRGLISPIAKLTLDTVYQVTATDSILIHDSSLYR